MVALTVFLAPTGVADAVFSALADLSAAGLIEPFHWARDPSASGPPQTLLRVSAGRQSDITMQQIVAGERADVVRVCVVVPLTGEDPVLALEQEQFIAELLATTFRTARIVRVRVGIAVPSAQASRAAHPAVEGWHNIVIAPEDGRGPDMGHLQLPPNASNAVMGRHAAPIFAGLLGLWSGVNHRPLDEVPPPPGQVCRLARSYYRKVDTSEAEAGVRRELLSHDGVLPLPTDQRSPVGYVHDVARASGTMAEQFWHKYASVLKGPRREAESGAGPERIGLWAALKMFIGFLWAAIKNAPAAWYQSMVDSVSTGIAATVNKAVFGSDSAYEVVVNGRTPKGERADWADIAAATSTLSGALGSPDDAGGHTARSDLSGVWQDYSRAAMTLADAGARSNDLPPVQVGANRGVLGQAAKVVPGPAQRFTAIPGVVAASVQIAGVDATDPLGVVNLRHKLSDLEGTTEHGRQARATLNALDGWQRETADSFGVAVGRRLADAFADRYDEVRNLLSRLNAAPAVPAEPGRNTKQARWIQVVIVLLVLLSSALGYLAYREMLVWWWAVLIAVGAALLGFGLTFVAFMRDKQELFQLMNKRRLLLNQREVDLQNLRTALRDLNRLSQAYSEFLCWSRALGAFLAAPLGPDNYEARATLRVSWGLPLSTAVGYATPPEAEIDNAVGHLRRELFGVGWLGAVWEELVMAADPTPGDDREATVQDSALWHQPGRDSGSVLDRWSAELFSGQRTSTGAEATWRRAQRALHGSMAQLAESLVHRVEVPGAQAVTRDQFLAELDRPAGGSSATGSFDRSLLTDTAVITGAGAVATDIRHTAVDGVGVIAAATQLSGGMGLDYLNLGERAANAPAEWTGSVPAPTFEVDHRQSIGELPADQFRPPQAGGGFDF